MIDLSSIMSKRAENVTARDPDLTVRYSLYTDDRHEWGILHILDFRDKVIGLEFFESEDSWRRPSAVDDYNMAADEGYPASVVIPDEVFPQFIRSMHERRGEGFSTYLLSELNLAPRIRA